MVRGSFGGMFVILQTETVTPLKTTELWNIHTNTVTSIIMSMNMDTSMGMATATIITTTRTP